MKVELISFFVSPILCAAVYTSFEEFIFDWDYSLTMTPCSRDWKKFTKRCTTHKSVYWNLFHEWGSQQSITLTLNFPRALYKVFFTLKMVLVSTVFIKIQTLAAPKKRSLESIFNLRHAACDVGLRFIKMSKRFSCNIHWRDGFLLLQLNRKYYRKNLKKNSSEWNVKIWKHA